MDERRTGGKSERKSPRLNANRDVKMKKRGNRTRTPQPLKEGVGELTQTRRGGGKRETSKILLGGGREVGGETNRGERKVPKKRGKINIKRGKRGVQHP